MQTKKVNSRTATDSDECSEEQESETIRKKVGAKIESLNKKLRDAEQVARSTFAIFQELRSMLSELDELITQLAEVSNKKIKSLEEQTGIQQDEISSLNERVEELNEKVKKLEGSKQKLLLGQLAFDVDQALVDMVFKDIDCDTGRAQIYHIYQMEKAIKGKCPYTSLFQKHERARIRKKWNDLQAKLGWEERHYIGLTNLKDLRFGEGHPKEYTTEEMKDAIQNASRTEIEMEVSQEFMKMLENIKLL